MTRAPTATSQARPTFSPVEAPSNLPDRHGQVGQAVFPDGALFAYPLLSPAQLEGTIRRVRTQQVVSDRTRPLSLSTCSRCIIADRDRDAGRHMLRGAAARIESGPYSGEAVIEHDDPRLFVRADSRAPRRSAPRPESEAGVRRRMFSSN